MAEVICCPRCNYPVATLNEAPAEQAEPFLAASERRRQDNRELVRAYLNARAVKLPRGRTPSPELTADFEAWCQRNGELQISKRALGVALKDLGVQQGRTSAARYYKDLVLRG
ncbi:hypothetical protein [Micrococcus lylae]|uniref:Uncharacterized protein n=1 Tax=Micrococcus lylae TaxID=1273 RepID=A0ABY2JZL4_9MICC|nr:hypothetical protein [Micrococcus lylae]TFH97816.1 hypothetical protein E4A49_11765 [Micrococcus lylae]